MLRIGTLAATAALIIAPGAARGPVTLRSITTAVLSLVETPSTTAVPTVSFVPDTPVLTQRSPRVWATTVVVDSTPGCLPSLTYQFDFVPSGSVLDGEAGTPAPVRPASTRHIKCGGTGGEDYSVPVVLKLKEEFSSVPTGATLVVDEPGGNVETDAIVLSLHRRVAIWQYIWIPVGSGALMALLFVLMIRLVPGLRVFGLDDPDVHPIPDGFWVRPVYATAAWTFKDSWATNVAAAGTALAGILTGAGAVSTLLPGVQLDRFTILLSACGAIIVGAPLIFGICNSLCSRSRLNAPDDATFQLPDAPAVYAEICVPDGASISFAGGALPDHRLPAGATVSARPGSVLEVRGGRIAAATTSAAVLAVFDGTTLISDRPFLVVAPSAPATAPAPAAVPALVAPPVQGPAAPPAPLQTIHVPRPLVATLAVTGVADITLPAGTKLRAPGGPPIRLTSPARLKVPGGTNVIVADMRSVLPAAIVTLFGIGAELGILGVLASGLSAMTPGARVAAGFGIGAIGAITLLYAVLTTRTLGDFTAGSALAADGSSYTL